jgi:hypothetical protein
MDDRTAVDRGPFIPKPKVAARYGTTSRAFDRWRRDPSLGFPQPICINGFLFFSEPELIAWEQTRAAEVGSPKYAKGVVKHQRKRGPASSVVRINDTVRAQDREL